MLYTPLHLQSKDSLVTITNYLRRVFIAMMAAAVMMALLMSLPMLAGTIGAPVAVAQEGTAKPNIIYIVADDADKQLLFSMPNIKRLLVEQGTFLENYYIPQAACCPSRTSVLTGEYTHNHRVVGNNAPEGGFAKYRRMGHDPDNVAGPVEAQGYNSGLFGKFLNEYGHETSSSAYEGANWTQWFGVFNQQRYDWKANDNGTVRAFGTTAASYADDVIWRKSRSFTFNQLDNGTPVFTYWSPLAPHSAGKGDYPAPPGYGNLDPGPTPSFEKPSFDEADVSDKPSFVRDNPRISPTVKQSIGATYKGRYRMLRNVDDQVKELYNALAARGQLDNTYIVLTSDNGWHEGEHRIDDSKLTPYEEASNVGAVVRGPGIPAGVTKSELASAHDLYATFTDMADGAAGRGIDRDGRSLLPLLQGTNASWRHGVLIENLAGRGEGKPNYYRIVTYDPDGSHYKYIEHDNGEKELYDLNADPYELESFDETADPALLENFSSRLARLKVCAGDSCRAAEDGL
jgi:N-acetylglucosamine-6-sulfatase